MAHFEIKNLTFSHAGAKDRQSLKDVSLTVNRGEYLVVCGRSGSGKTTLLRHLKTVLTPAGKRSGEILFGGVPLSQVSQRDQAAKIGYVMQNPDEQIVTDKVWHELAFGLESLGCDQKTMRLRVAEMACYFGIQDWFHRDVATLSGGQKQLLNLASIMAMQPEALILDEPTSQLDPIAASDFLNTVRKINLELGTTVILTEHRLEDILPYADRAVVLDEGEIIADGAPKAVCEALHAQDNPMFFAMPTPARAFYGAGGKGECPLTVREGRAWLTETFAERPVRVGEPEPEAPLGEEVDAAISMKEVWFRYEKNSPDVLRGVNLEVPRGRLFAIVGGNGAGKSTTLKAVCGTCRAYRGRVLIDGKPLNKYRTAELFRGKLAMLPQDPKSLFVKKTVREELEEMGGDAAEIDRVSALCQIQPFLNSHPYDLSGGEQQRAALAKVLMTKPTILLLDEPTKGVDSFFKQTFAEILAQLKAQGVTLLIVSHDVEFCAKYADLVGMFFDGQLLTVDTPRRFFGQNSFYTSAANRMSRCVFRNAVSCEDVIDLYRKNMEDA